MSDTLIKPQAVVEALWRATKGEAYITSDVGSTSDVGGTILRVRRAESLDQLRRARNHGIWIAGGARRVALGKPDETVVACITGEASIQMCIQELSTCTAVQHTGQDHYRSEQSLHGHGAAVAGIQL